MCARACVYARVCTRVCACVCSKTFKRDWAPASLGLVSTRAYPNIVIDNWAAAFKVRAHYEEVSERRRAAGKPVF